MIINQVCFSSNFYSSDKFFSLVQFIGLILIYRKVYTVNTILLRRIPIAAIPSWRIMFGPGERIDVPALDELLGPQPPDEIAIIMRTNPNVQIASDP